ncbi:MAG: trypsin-like serine protease [Alphaproteobacteria bacterium]|nr:trypsin-like serine protease [Alphaproteobacteria bacterium]
MIKIIKFVFLSFLLCAPVVAGAADHCTNPNEYTVDRRCYVTDAQKTQKPFSSVVALFEKGDIYCTGTLVRTYDKGIMVYTAKHCVTDDSEQINKQKITVLLQNGQELDAKLVDSGKVAYGADDWAIYYITNNLTFQLMENVEPVVLRRSQLLPMSNVSVVGYGSLKVVSDKEIAEFKQKYFDYLVQEVGANLTVTTPQEKSTLYGIESDGSVRISHNLLKKWWADMMGKGGETRRYIIDLFWNNFVLKVSNCIYNSYGDTHCQGWGGNSGGPWFDSENNLAGITSGGNFIFGGKNHGEMTAISTVENIHDNSYLISGTNITNDAKH